MCFNSLLDRTSHMHKHSMATRMDLGYTIEWWIMETLYFNLLLILLVMHRSIERWDLTKQL